MKKILAIPIFLLIIIVNVNAEHPDDTPSALKGLKNTKVIFDVNVGNPDLLNLRMKLIKKTLSDLSAYGNYTAVVAFRGKASDFMTKNNKHIDKEDNQIKKEIYQRIKSLKNDYNVVLEQCAVAIGLRDISPSKIYDIINVVPNGYVSIIGYQNRGYAYVPMD